MNERRTLNSGRYYFKDEVLFHELTHCINGIYENFMENLSLWFDLDKMFENNFSVKSDAIESMANDPNYRQKSYSWLVLDEFVDCIVNDKPIHTTAVEGAKTVKASLAAVESSKTGMPVKIEYDF